MTVVNTPNTSPTKMTTLHNEFLWHQFKAGSWMRFLLLPFALIFIFGGAWVGTWASIAGGSVIGTITLLGILYPDQSVFRAYGMSAARARQQLLTVTVPVVASAVLAYLLLQPHPMRGVVGAVISIVSAAVFVIANDAVGDQAQGDEREGRRVKPHGSFAFQAMWREGLTWSVVTGIALVVCMFVAGFIPISDFSAVVASLPVLVGFVWFGQYVVEGGLSPLVAKSYGLTRKQWAANAVGLSIVAGLLLATIAGAGSLLLPLETDVHWQVFFVIAVAVAAYGILAAGLMYKTRTIVIMAGFLLWFAIRDLMQFEGMDLTAQLPLVALTIAAVVALTGGLSISLYVAGRINITNTDMGRMAGINKAE